MSKSVTVAVDVNAVDTRTQATGQGSVTAPSLVVPSGYNIIKKIIAAFSHDGAADDGTAIAFMRLGGSAVKGGEQVIIFGGGGNQTVQSGSDSAPNVMEPFILEDVDIEVSPSDVLDLAAEFAGVDIGDTHMVFTVVYGKQ